MSAGGVVPYYADDSIALYLGDCRELLPQLDLRQRVFDLRAALNPQETGR